MDDMAIWLTFIMHTECYVMACGFTNDNMKFSNFQSYRCENTWILNSSVFKELRCAVESGC
jgi:hypothetical protein